MSTGGKRLLASDLTGGASCELALSHPDVELKDAPNLSRIEQLSKQGAENSGGFERMASKKKSEGGDVSGLSIAKWASRPSQVGGRRSELMNEINNMDVDKDGFISMKEVASFVDRKLVESQAHAKERTRAKFLKRLLVVIALAVVLAVTTNAALTLAIVAYMKDLAVASDGTTLLIHGTNQPARMASADVALSGDTLVSRANGHAVQTTAKLTPLALDSRLPDEVLHEMHYADFTSPTGSTLHIFVQAVVRVVVDDSLHGTVVRMHTMLGTIELDGPIVTFADGMQGAFTNAGFKVVPGQRRLQGVFSLIGLFNSVPAFDGWDAHDAPPKIPTTFTAEAALHYQCRHGNEDLCDAFAVPAASTTVLQNGEKNTVTNLEIWADLSLGLVREKFTRLPHLDGWELEKLTEIGSGLVHTAQVWQTTGEAFFCRTNADPTAGTLGPFGSSDASKLVAAYKGQLEAQGAPSHKFVVKHREVANMTVEYITRELDTSKPYNRSEMGVLMQPISITLTIGAAGSPQRRMTYYFKKFAPVTSVAESSFKWWTSPFSLGAADASFDESVCASTFNLTSTGQIPAAATIWGTSPFAPMGSSPDSTDFVLDLKFDPQLTGAEWVAQQNQTVDESETRIDAGALAPPPAAPPTRRLQSNEPWPNLADLRDSAVSPPPPKQTMCGDCAYVNPFTGWVDTSKCNFDSAAIKVYETAKFLRDTIFGFGPCVGAVSVPNGCAGNIRCQAEWPISATPPVFAVLTGSTEWDFTPPGQSPMQYDINGCIGGGVTSGVPRCTDCPKLADLRFTLCAAAQNIVCPAASAGEFTELTFSGHLNAWAVLIGADLKLNVYSYPNANDTWCPEKRSNYINQKNHQISIEGKITVCFIWCWDIFNGYLAPYKETKTEEYWRTRRANGFGASCWNQCKTNGNSGACSVCEGGQGSCCRKDWGWTPECIGQGESSWSHRCGDTNLGCADRCAPRTGNTTLGTTKSFVAASSQSSCIKQNRWSSWVQITGKGMYQLCTQKGDNTRGCCYY